MRKIQILGALSGKATRRQSARAREVTNSGPVENGAFSVSGIDGIAVHSMLAVSSGQREQSSQEYLASRVAVVNSRTVHSERLA